MSENFGLVSEYFELKNDYENKRKIESRNAKNNNTIVVVYIIIINIFLFNNILFNKYKYSLLELLKFIILIYEFI